MEPEPLPDVFSDTFTPKARISKCRTPKIKQEKVDQTIEDLFNKLFENSHAFITKPIEISKPEENKPATRTKSVAPEDKALKIGPKPLTIAEYKQRQLKHRRVIETPITEKKRTRAGKKVQLKKQIARLYQVIPIATGTTKHNLIKDLRILKQQLYGNGRPANEANRFNGNKARNQPPQ